MQQVPDVAEVKNMRKCREMGLALLGTEPCSLTIMRRILDNSLSILKKYDAFVEVELGWVGAHGEKYVDGKLMEAVFDAFPTDGSRKKYQTPKQAG